jgi:nicotinate-nucleotide adenylyltransferase
VSEPRPRRVGILGGTFDPIHLGHIAAARAAIRCAQLDELLLVPAGVPPHRSAATASPDDRLAMVRLAAEGEAGMEVSDLEIRRGGRSYTVDTLRELHRRRPADELHLVLGWDAAREVRTWREPDAVLRLARIVIVTRPGLPPPTPADVRAAGIDPARAVLCPEPTPDVEATEIREALATGRSLEGMLAPAVAGYIESRGLYRPTGRA